MVAISVAFLKAQRMPKEWPEIADMVVRASQRCSGALGYSVNLHNLDHLQDAALGATFKPSTH